MSFLAPAMAKGGRTNRQRSIRTTHAQHPLLKGVDRIYATWQRADDSTLQEGMDWYQDAHDIGVSFAEESGIEPIQAIGIIAALSPNTAWFDNIRIARRVCGGDMSGHMGNPLSKCEAILNGADPLDVLGGRKVRSFYTNMLLPTRPGHVTVDRHMIDLITGERGTINQKLLDRPGVYQRTAGMFRAAARREAVLPHQMQAVVWCQHRKDHDVAIRKYDKEMAA